MLVKSRQSEYPILGRPPQSTIVVPWDASGSCSRPDFRLLYKEFTQGPCGKALLERTLKTVVTFNCARCIMYLTYVFNKGTAPIKVGAIRTTPLGFQEELSSASLMPADSIGPITFMGGPPSRRAFYQGTFITMLQDNILSAVHTNDTKRLILLRDSRILNA